VELKVNGDSMTFDPAVTVGAIVAQLGLDKGPVAVERNGQVVPRSEHASTVVTEGDVIEIVHFVGGG